jgi:hypothetical protein
MSNRISLNRMASYWIFTIFSSYIIPIILLILFSYFLVVSGLRDLATVTLAISFLWALSLPIISALPYSYTFVLCFPAPWLGLYSIVSLWFLKLGHSDFYSFLLISVGIPLLIILLQRLMLKSVALTESLNRIIREVLTIVCLGLSIIFLSPFTLNPYETGHLIVLIVLLAGYLVFSISYVNESYRLGVLARKFKTRNLESTILNIFKKLQQKYPSQSDDIALLEYSLRSSIDFFKSGDYERSFIEGCKIIRDKTIVEPKTVINDRIDEEKTFSQVRAIILHTEIGHKPVKAQDIKKTKKELFELNIKLYERIFEFLEKIE